jgi:hypothetical protein
MTQQAVKESSMLRTAGKTGTLRLGEMRTGEQYWNIVGEAIVTLEICLTYTPSTHNAIDCNSKSAGTLKGQSETDIKPCLIP